MLDEAKLAIHQVTFMRQWNHEQCVEGLARAGIPRTAVWHEKMAEVGVAKASRLMRDSGVKAVALCASGFLALRDDSKFQARLDDNRRLIEAAAELGAPNLVFVPGGLEDGDKDLEFTRVRGLEGLSLLIPDARAAGVRLALEPLHPMVASLRSAVTTMEEANDWLDELDADDALGIALDTYAVWWDRNLAREIARAGKRICCYHISDWLQDTRDIRLDRGMMGDGVIDFLYIRGLLENVGFDGFYEVEIFSERDWWQRDPEDVIRIIRERYRTAV
jgi:sugar phosphate isomerase/epimerase